MALASRSARRSGAGRRWLVVAIVITLLVLLIDASLRSRSPGPGQQLAAGSWIDRVLPIVSASTAEGNQLAGIWTSGVQTSATSLSYQLNQIAGQSAHDYQQLVALPPPTSAAGAAGLLEACLLTRSQAASTLRAAFLPMLGGSGAGGASSGSTTTAATSAGVDPAVKAIQAAGNDIQISDRAYQLFVHNLPKVGVTLPPSAWGSNATPYQPDAAQLFVTSLQNNLRATPVHQLEIYSVALTPAPVSLKGQTQVLPGATTLGVTVVVADTGNQPEKGLTVTAAIAAGGTSSSVRDFLDLTAGQARTISEMGPLNPPQGVPVTLTVTVTPVAGSAATAVTKTLTFVMAAPSPSSTSTTPAG
jgi:hypothetical protein